jgi:hypothetical protein
VALATLGSNGPVLATEPAPIVIFVQGLNGDTDSSAALFYYVQSALHSLEPDTLYLDYGYRGGFFDSLGDWHANLYGACDTHQSVFTSASELRATIASARDHWPDRKVAVIGHSLGGLLAMLQLAASASEQESGAAEDQDMPDVVVSVDAPLRGTSHPLAAIVQAQTRPVDCTNDAALDELAGLRDNDAGSVLARGVGVGIEHGVQVLMVANLNDSAYACCRVGGTAPSVGSEAASQYLDVPGSTVWKFATLSIDLPNVAPGLIGLTGSHHAALFNSAVVRNLAQFILASAT